MVIKPKELTHIQESRELKVEYVFFDKTDRPRTRTGKGVTEGILMLTDNELAFFSNGRGKSSIFGRVGIELAKDVANHFTFGLASLAEYGIGKGIRHWKDKPMDFISSAQNDASIDTNNSKLRKVRWKAFIKS